MPPSVRCLGCQSSELGSEALAELVSANLGGNTIGIKNRISTRSNSIVYEGWIGTDQPLPVAIKRCFVPGTNELDTEGASEQFLALKRLSDACGRNTPKLFRVPDPICIIPDYAIYVMGWAIGESLTNKLGALRAVWDAKIWFEQVGTWMGYFHSAGPLQERIIDSSDRIEAINDLNHSLISQQSFVRALKSAKDVSNDYLKTRSKTSWLHGDCKTDNFILGCNDVFGIDVSLKHENSVEYDVGQFLNNLYLRLSSPRWIYLKPFLNQYEKAFKDGYRSAGIEFSDRYLAWIRLTLALSLWDDRLGRSEPSLRNRVLNAMFSSLADHLVDSLKNHNKSSR